MTRPSVGMVDIIREHAKRNLSVLMVHTSPGKRNSPWKLGPLLKPFTIAVFCRSKNRNLPQVGLQTLEFLISSKPHRLPVTTTLYTNKRLRFRSLFHPFFSESII
ncbi:hypothetical protein CC2G_005778 [Coprinopsis cinerea AmutBmut pab1-1]|nr:hypothetical protein CC2G_005778 [Coprinopsis cinerea AmutBmut pab1-1]